MTRNLKKDSLDVNTSIEVVASDISINPFLGRIIIIHNGELIVRDRDHDLNIVPASALMVFTSASKSFTLLMPLSCSICTTVLGGSWWVAIVPQLTPSPSAIQNQSSMKQSHIKKWRFIISSQNK